MAVKVKRERPDQRRHHRVTAPLYVEVEGVSARASDWSLGGLRVEDFEGELPATGAEIALQLTLPFQGFDVGFAAKAEVVRTNPQDRMFAVRFTEIGERERELMQHFIEELVRGAMVDIEDTIQRIDVPVTPASLQPDLPRAVAAQVPVHRMPVKAAVMSAIYLGLGAVIFGYAGLLAYTNFFRMEVQTAVMTAPVETVLATDDGTVRLPDLKPGSNVRENDIIVDLVNTQLEREVELAELGIQERKSKLAFTKKKHIEELDRVRSYAAVEMKNIQQTRVELDALAMQLKIAETNRQRLKELYDKGFLTESKLQDAERQALVVRKDFDIRRIELASRVEIADHDLGKRMFTGSETIGSADIVGQGPELEAEIRLIEHEIQFAQQKYITALNRRSLESVRAPFDGTILQLPRTNNAAVRRGDVIAVIEQRKNRQVTAFLNQDEVLRIGLDDEVSVFVPSVGKTIKGFVKDIDRTSGFIREQEQRTNPGATWRGPTDRSAKVTIAFFDPREVEDYEKYRTGVPVVAVFERRATNSVLSKLGNAFGL